MKLLVATALALLLAAAPASAAVFNVNTTADTGTCDAATTCSLRGALILAARTDEGDTVNLVDLSAAPYQVTQGQLDVPAGVEIFGLGADLTTIAGDGKSSRVFRVRAGAQVRFANLTIAKGAALTDTDPFGGNVLVESGGNVLLDHVRITQGVALRGGGIAARGGVLEIRHSLIDGNEARASQATGTADGGGVLSAPVGDSVPGVETLTISDSTIAFNTARAGAGITVRDNPNGATTLTRVTVARNTANAAAGGGLAVAAGTRAPDVAGSIVADNAGQPARIGGPNCLGVATESDRGGNLESGTDCGFTRPDSRQDPNTGLATALTNDGGMLPVLPISTDSPARDLAGACTGTDQRDVARPQGALCDAGAYEYLPPPPPPPQPTPTAGAQPTVSPTPTPSATPTPVPTPVANKTVVARKVSGKVLVRVPGSRRFVEIDAALGIPVGSIVDTRKGVVELTSQPRPGAPAQTARFYSGIFKVTQKRGITDLKLTEKLARCTKRARAAAKRPKTRRLWGDGKGAFRTTGRYSAATVRGTKWLVQDSCAGTLTRVTQGAVTVRDNVRKRTKIVRAGKRYRARPKR